MQKIKKISDTGFKVLSSDGKHYYDVDTHSKTCTCTGFKFYKKCKHLEAVLGLAGKTGKKSGNFAEIIEKLNKKQYTIYEFNEEFGAELLERLQNEGIIFVSKGRIFVI